MADDLDDFTDPKKLKGFFEEVDEEFENLHGVSQNARAADSALRIAVMAILGALDDSAPNVRQEVLRALDEGIKKAEGSPSDAVPVAARAADIDAMVELRTVIDLASASHSDTKIMPCPP